MKKFIMVSLFVSVFFTGIIPAHADILSDIATEDKKYSDCIRNTPIRKERTQSYEFWLSWKKQSPATGIDAPEAYRYKPFAEVPEQVLREWYNREKAGAQNLEKSCVAILAELNRLKAIAGLSTTKPQVSGDTTTKDTPVKKESVKEEEPVIAEYATTEQTTALQDRIDVAEDKLTTIENKVDETKKAISWISIATVISIIGLGILIKRSF